MGCCSSNNLKSLNGVDEERIKSAIDRNNGKKLVELKKLLPLNANKNLINEAFTVFQGFSLNPLGYALFRNKYESFLKLIELGAEVQALDDLLQSQSKSILYVICYFGFTDFFKYLLPALEANYRQSILSVSENNISMDFDSSHLYDTKQIKFNTPPIQVATEQGHLGILDIVFNYSKLGTMLPAVIDIHYVFEKTGENCALVACRKGLFPIVKYLWETIHADFSVLNKNKENALVVTAAGSKKNLNGEYFSVFSYLIEVVKIDFNSCYEEILLLLENKQIISYFSKLLKNNGICAKKNEIEEAFKPNPVERQKKFGAEMNGNKFEIKKLMVDSEDSESFISNVPSESFFTYFVSSFFGSSDSVVKK